MYAHVFGGQRTARGMVSQELSTLFSETDWASHWPDFDDYVKVVGHRIPDFA